MRNPSSRIRGNLADPLRIGGFCAAGLLFSIGSLAADFDELNYGDDHSTGRSVGERLLAVSPDESVVDSAPQQAPAAEPKADREDDADVIGAGRRFEQSFISGAGGEGNGHEILSTRVRGVDLHGSAKLRAELERLAETLDRGLHLIESELDGPGLVERPQFWLLDNDTEFVAAIQNRQPEIRSERLLMAAKARAYIHGQNSFFVYKAGIARGRLLRLLYEEYALQHLNMMAAGGIDQRVAWFHSGFATYLAWITEAELNRMGRDDVFAGMLRTYGPNFDPDRAPNLKTLESPKSWAQAMRSDYRGTYAQAALGFQYFIQRFTLGAGPRVLRSMSTGESFEQAFENATQVSLGRFELELRETIYPAVRKLRAAVQTRAEAKGATEAKDETGATTDAEPAKTDEKSPAASENGAAAPGGL